MLNRISRIVFLTIFVTAIMTACTPKDDGQDAGSAGPDFSLNVTVKRVDGEALASDLTIEADAYMPAHGHGMLPEVEPITTQLEDEGRFRVDGMNLLMDGLWELYVDVKTAEKTERATFSVEVEGEGEHTMMDGGHMGMEDGGHMGMEDGGHMGMEDGGHMEMDAG
jgi:hypothetical protein